MRGHHNNHARAEKGSSTVVHKGRGSGSNDADQGVRLNAGLRESVQLYGRIDERCVPCREKQRLACGAAQGHCHRSSYQIDSITKNADCCNRFVSSSRHR